MNNSSEVNPAPPAQMYQVLHCTDSAFPVGSFHYSFGLEFAFKSGIVAGNDNRRRQQQQVTNLPADTVAAASFSAISLIDYCRAVVDNTIAQLVPFILQSHKLFYTVDKKTQPTVPVETWRALQKLELQLHAVLQAGSSALSLRAQKQMGQSFCNALCSTYSTANEGGKELWTQKMLTTFSSHVERNQLLGLHPIIFGAYFGSIDCSAAHTLQAYLFSTMRTITAAAVRLDMIGPLAVLPVQKQLADYCEQQSSLAVTRENLAGEMIGESHVRWPTLEIIAGMHVKLFDRMFYN